MFAALAIGATDTIRTYDLGSRNPPVRTARPDALPTYWVLRRHAKLVGLPFVRGSSGVRLPIFELRLLLPDWNVDTTAEANQVADVVRLRWWSRGGSNP